MFEATAHQPKYIQLADYLLKNIRDGSWPVGSAIPSEYELVTKFRVSRNTVREAMGELERLGYIFRIHGKGSYVSSVRLNQRFNNLTSFSEDISSLGLTPSHKNIEIRKIKAEEAISTKLHLPPGSDCMFLHRLLLADDVPFIVVKTYIPAHWLEIQGISISEKTLGKGSFYSLLSAHGIVFNKASITARAMRATSQEAKYLGISKGSPVLATERLSFSSDDVPRELTFGIGHPDRQQWTMMVYKDIDTRAET